MVPLDLKIYDASNLRNPPPSCSDAPLSEAERLFRTLLGYRAHAQADVSSQLEITEENGWMSSLPWVTISDTYANFMREKNAEIVIGHVTGADSDIARITMTLSPNSSVETITRVDAISSPVLDINRLAGIAPRWNIRFTFLPAILPQQMFLPCPNPATTTIGFVGMACIKAHTLGDGTASTLLGRELETLSKDAEAMRSIRRSREQGRMQEHSSRDRRQWSCDYVGVMKGSAERLGVVEGTPFSINDSSASSSKGKLSTPLCFLFLCFGFQPFMGHGEFIGGLFRI